MGEGVSVGNGCVFGTASRWVTPGPVEDKSVFYGSPLQTRIANEIPASAVSSNSAKMLLFLA